MASERPRTSDQLGRIGENSFQQMCVDTGDLIVNKSHDHDAAGWDYIVDFPFSGRSPHPKLRSSLDTRTPPISCRVQVKSSWHDRDVVNLKLSTLSRLASHPGPAFIYVLKFSHTLEVSAAYIIHLRDDNLATILKRLRSEDQKGNTATDLSDKDLSFAPTKCGIAIGSSGKDFSDAINGLVGGSDRLPAYVAEKEHQRISLGYADNALVASLSFRSDFSELVDGSLSLRALTATKFNVTITRFGIPLPQFTEPLTDVIVNISATEPNRCALVARPRDGSNPLSFDVEFRVPGIPDLPEQHFKAIVLAKLFTITLQNDRGKLKTADVSSVGAHFIDDWRDYHRLISSLSSTPVDFELVHPDRGTCPIARTDPDSFNTDWDVNLAVRACDQIGTLAELCGCSFRPLTWDDIVAASNEISSLLSLATSPVGKGYSIRITHDNVPPPGTVPINYITVFPLGSQTIAYALRAEATQSSPDSDGKTSVSVEFKTFDHARVIANLNDDYLSFRNALIRNSGVDNFCEDWSPQLNSTPPTIRSAAQRT